ncbi:hypothetical protein Acr_09g0005340 [Actinidia rufa]|uniref:Uncharacterized protein n=1 Tax=Actinidia rufa TaxID=165716 RepID=A0A7J0F5V2_9ERIC|nr:hypothetical protein Acr_09g0005340 [Actinidia rufa]
MRRSQPIEPLTPMGSRRNGQSKGGRYLMLGINRHMGESTSSHRGARRYTYMLEVVTMYQDSRMQLMVVVARARDGDGWMVMGNGGLFIGVRVTWLYSLMNLNSRLLQASYPHSGPEWSLGPTYSPVLRVRSKRCHKLASLGKFHELASLGGFVAYSELPSWHSFLMELYMVSWHGMEILAHDSYCAQPKLHLSHSLAGIPK